MVFKKIREISSSLKIEQTKKNPKLNKEKTKQCYLFRKYALKINSENFAFFLSVNKKIVYNKSYIATVLIINFPPDNKAGYIGDIYL